MTDSRAQLYAVELNKQLDSENNPATVVIATNGNDIAVGAWDQAKPLVQCTTKELTIGSRSGHGPGGPISAQNTREPDLYTFGFVVSRT